MYPHALKNEVSEGTKALSVQRYEALDCIRGLAALAVFNNHSLVLAKGYSILAILSWLPIKILWGGGEAVILFFVLSGFSLFLLFESMNSVRWRTAMFIASRWARLYPVYLFSILVSIIIYSVLDNTNYEWPNLGVYTRSSITIKNIFEHTLMIGYFDVNSYDPPIWSIVHEIRISILFPIIYFLVKKMGQ